MSIYDLTMMDEPSMGLQPRLLRRTLGRRSPDGVLTSSVQPGEAVDSVSRYRNRGAELYAEAERLSQTEPDMSGLQEYAKQRSQQGDSAMLNALAANFAGERFQPVQAQFLKRAAAAREPLKAGSGFITPDGQYITDPSEGRSKRVDFLMQQARQYEQMAQNAQSEDQRRRAEAAQNEIMNQIRLAQLQISQFNAQTNRSNATAGGGQGRAPAGYQWTTTEDGQPALTFIPGGPKDPANKSAGQPSEDERKAAGWFFQADNAIRNMQDVLRKNPQASAARVPERLAGVVPVFGDDFANLLRPADRQRYVQAAESMSEALLRASTGAAITAAETNQKLRELIPQIGDGPEVIKQKLDSYQVYMDALRARANRALPQNMQGGTGAPAAANNDPLGLRGGR